MHALNVRIRKREASNIDRHHFFDDRHLLLTISDQYLSSNIKQHQPASKQHGRDPFADKGWEWGST